MAHIYLKNKVFSELKLIETVDIIKDFNALFINTDYDSEDDILNIIIADKNNNFNIELGKKELNEIYLNFKQEEKDMIATIILEKAPHKISLLPSEQLDTEEIELIF